MTEELGTLSQALEDAGSRIQQEVDAGYDEPSEILEGVLEMLADEFSHLGDLTVPLTEALDRALAAKVKAEAAWPETTDNDRLDRAFAALEREGVVARQNFTCCQTCGHAEIWDEIHEVSQGGAGVEGYAFFHMQDTESAVDGCGLYLAYGAVLGPEEDEGLLEERACAVGKQITAALEDAGLKVDWNGTTSARILVPKFDWKRRSAVA